MKNICPKCKLENPFEARFCGQCGTSLSQKCPICGTEQSLAMKFCTKCGVELGKADENIKYAERMRGGAGRDISFRYKGWVYEPLSPISHMMADRHTLRYTLDADEYVLKEADEVNLHYGNELLPGWRGHLWLTNKNLILLGYEPKDRIDHCEITWKLNEITDVNFKLTKALFGYGRQLFFKNNNGEQRRIDGSGTDSFTPEWAVLINQFSATK